MAGGAAKKNAANAARIKARNDKIIWGFTAFYLLLRVIWNWDSFGFWAGCAFVFFTLVNKFCGGQVVSAAAEGVEAELSEDTLYVNWFVQVGSIFSGWVWLVYLLVPGVLIFKHGPMLKKFIDMWRGGTAEGGQATSQSGKKSGKVKYKTSRR